MMETMDVNVINQKLIDYLLALPSPYTDILQEQINASRITNELYPDCYIMHFHQKGNVRQLPLWLPILLQGCQVLKETGPISCQLYVEYGYIVQFEVVDMGLNRIDWEYFWSHKATVDIEYDLAAICDRVTTESLCISNVRIDWQCVDLVVDTYARHYTVSLRNSHILALNLPQGEYSCRLEICVSENDSRPYLLKSHDHLVAIECSMISLRNGRHIS